MEAIAASAARLPRAFSPAGGGLCQRRSGATSRGFFPSAEPPPAGGSGSKTRSPTVGIPARKLAPPAKASFKLGRRAKESAAARGEAAPSLNCKTVKLHDLATGARASTSAKAADVLTDATYELRGQAEEDRAIFWGIREETASRRSTLNSVAEETPELVEAVADAVVNGHLEENGKHGVNSHDFHPSISHGSSMENPMETRVQRRRTSMEEDEDGEGDTLKEECGVVGIFGDPEASRLCYLSLHALQHRGQEGAGIVACDEGSLRSVTGMGLVSEVFNQSALSKLTGSSAVGHVRYATAGESALKNVQPFVAGYRFGSVGVAHNGNLVNYNELRAMLEEDGSIFNTSSDTEVVLHLIAISKARPFIARLVDACQQLEGAYSMVFLTEDKLVAVRDPHGFRPLVMGRRQNGGIVFASETCALDLIEATYEREIHPGEVVVVDEDGISSLCLMPQRRRTACVFEHIYFALPNSIVFGLSVYQSRYRIGEILALESPVDCDVVIAVPDSGVVAALGYASMAGVPFQQGLIRSHYVGRTFIEPSQKIRDFGVKLKLAPVKAVLKGKRVVVVDDSIVRGTTSLKIVRLIQDAGATEVHLRIASPPITGSCYYGVDTPSQEELISYRLNVEETRKHVQADSLAFLPLDSLRGMLGSDAPNFCYACFTGEYPVPPKTLSKDAAEKETAHKVLVDGLANSCTGASRGRRHSLS